MVLLSPEHVAVNHKSCLPLLSERAPTIKNNVGKVEHSSFSSSSCSSTSQTPCVPLYTGAEQLKNKTLKIKEKLAPSLIKVSTAGSKPGAQTILGHLISNGSRTLALEQCSCGDGGRSEATSASESKAKGTLVPGLEKAAGLVPVVL